MVQHDTLCLHVFLDVTKDGKTHVGNFFGSKPDVLNIGQLFSEYLKEDPIKKMRWVVVTRKRMDLQACQSFGLYRAQNVSFILLVNET